MTEVRRFVFLRAELTGDIKLHRGQIAVLLVAHQEFPVHRASISTGEFLPPS